ncbi:MAG: Dabb family protein [Bacteroidales bacterium]|jgi:hypothetical protein|nr:Dabb family protein [Bacteroidales bacterium]OPZ98979.1 MAG: Stress responsive A/B Barrel Domain protein [Bacteroidetes bacterium ADurb.Bin416]HBL73244.1 stress responsive protein [Bacteroidales bacterium]
MIKHIVFWTVKPTALGRDSQANALEMKSRLEALNGRIPKLLHLEVGLDLLHSAASADVALYSEFADMDALAAYQVHPEHEAVKTFIQAVTAHRMVIDYEV